MALQKHRIELTEEKMKAKKPANVKVLGYLRLMKFKESNHLSDLKKLTYSPVQK